MWKIGTNDFVTLLRSGQEDENWLEGSCWQKSEEEQYIEFMISTKHKNILILMFRSVFLGVSDIWISSLYFWMCEFMMSTRSRSLGNPQWDGIEYWEKGIGNDDEELGFSCIWVLSSTIDLETWDRGLGTENCDERFGEMFSLEEISVSVVNELTVVEYLVGVVWAIVLSSTVADDAETRDRGVDTEDVNVEWLMMVVVELSVEGVLEHVDKDGYELSGNVTIFLGFCIVVEGREFDDISFEEVLCAEIVAGVSDIREEAEEFEIVSEIKVEVVCGGEVEELSLFLILSLEIDLETRDRGLGTSNWGGWCRSVVNFKIAELFLVLSSEEDIKTRDRELDFWFCCNNRSLQDDVGKDLVTGGMRVAEERENNLCLLWCFEVELWFM